MKSKGFTLIETLGVLILLGVLITILISIVDEDLSYGKSFASDSQVKLIEESANIYYQTYKSEIPTIDSNNIALITVQTLFDKGFIDDKDLIINTKLTIEKTDNVILYLIDGEIYTLYDREQNSEPIIVLKGPSEIKITVNGSYYEYGAVVIDTTNVTISNLDPINITGSVNTSTEGEYEIIYSYSTSDQVKRKVIVEDTIIESDNVKPEITLVGASTISLLVGNTYNEQGAIAIDNKDGDITARITITGVVDTSTKGTYYRYYDVSDVNGNKANTITRIVNVN
ncbi:MAG: DUF5011 domain-containing protein [Bacilli bacterium]|nr:DUF5011 domain-containing protein [Bacilli bacterium]MDD3995306.1 DUF5011 domain-containing protein [Bacilli bacterium]MDD4831481.1 DUF5011 domain-containing protein [Bacilli bacterium]